MFTDHKTKVDNETPNGYPYKCEQTLNDGASSLYLSAGTSFTPIKESLRVWLPKRLISRKLGVQETQT